MELFEFLMILLSIIIGLALAGVVVGNAFRTLAFGEPLFAVDNASSIVSLISCSVLVATKLKPVHYGLATLAPVTILLDNLIISYVIN